jgi:hypothetical protein
MTKFGRPSGLERQARLKPQYASLYPGVVAGEWIPAWVLAEQLGDGCGKNGRDHQKQNSPPRNH